MYQQPFQMAEAIGHKQGPLSLCSCKCKALSILPILLQSYSHRNAINVINDNVVIAKLTNEMIPFVLDLLDSFCQYDQLDRVGKYGEVAPQKKRLDVADGSDERAPREQNTCLPSRLCREQSVRLLCVDCAPSTRPIESACSTDAAVHRSPQRNRSRTLQWRGPT